jgi:hypothetical protein
MRVEDDHVPLEARLDAVRVAPGAWRGVEAGPTASSSSPSAGPVPREDDSAMDPGWWPRTRPDGPQPTRRAIAAPPARARVNRTTGAPAGPGLERHGGVLGGVLGHELPGGEGGGARARGARRAAARARPRAGCR